MKEELETAITHLQQGEEADSQRAFGQIVSFIRRDSGICATALANSLITECQNGALQTPRLFTLLGLTREPLPQCVPYCLEFLRTLRNLENAVLPTEVPPTDALLGVAAVVALTKPTALVPDLSAIVENGQAEQGANSIEAEILVSLVMHSSVYLEQETLITPMVYWLWFDCARHDLMSLTDFMSFYLDYAGAENPIADLIVELVDIIPGTWDEKTYAYQSLKELGLSPENLSRLQAACRAIQLYPDSISYWDNDPPILDPDPPMPELRVDEWLVAFSVGDEQSIGLAEAAISGMFREPNPPVSLSWWLMLTVDDLPRIRRRDGVEWTLAEIAALQRRKKTQPIPVSVLMYWVNTPGFLSETGLYAAIEILCGQHAAMVVKHVLYRVIALSIRTENHSIRMKETWRLIAAANPSVILLIASRWVLNNYEDGGFLNLMISLCKPASTDPRILDGLADESPEVLEKARYIISRLREPED